MSLDFMRLYGFTASCEVLGLEVPEPITRAMHLVDVADATLNEPTEPVLSLTDEQLQDRVRDYALREHTYLDHWSSKGLDPGINKVKEEIEKALPGACLPYLDKLIEQLQPQFAELARPLEVAAQEYGFTYATTSDQVIDLADEGASQAWRDARRAWQEISPLVRFRIDMSEIFSVSPTAAELAPLLPLGERSEATNYSVAFAAQGKWSPSDGFYIEGRGRGHIDWLALAAGGLRLNTPTETRDKIAARRAKG